MDPAIIIFGLGIGILVGMTGMGGGSLMTPLLILIFGIQPTTAIGTDIFYSAVTKTVGSWRHLGMKTVNMDLVKWLALGSVPAAVIGVAIVSVLEQHVDPGRLDSLVYAVLGGTLLMVGVVTLTRALILRNLVDERDRFEIERRHKVAAVLIGATTGFVIGITSAGSGTVIAILLIAVYRLAPKKVVGTDVVHAAVLLWAAGIAHWVGGNVDFALAGTILLGSVPGRGRSAPRFPARRRRASSASRSASSSSVRASSRSRRATRPSGRSPPLSPRSASARFSTRRIGCTGAACAKQGGPSRARPTLRPRPADRLTPCASPQRPTTRYGRQPSWRPPRGVRSRASSWPSRRRFPSSSSSTSCSS